MIAAYTLLSYVECQQNGHRNLQDNNQIYGSHNGIGGSRNYINGNHDLIIGNDNGVAGNENKVYGDGNLVFGDDNNVVTNEALAAIQAQRLKQQAQRIETERIRKENLRQAAKLKYTNVETTLGTVIVIPLNGPVPEGFRLMKIDEGKQVKDAFQSIMFGW